MNEEMSAAWRKMVGVTLTWFALACLTYAASADGTRSTLLATLGLISFVTFVTGVALFSEGMKRDILRHTERM